MNRCPDLVVCLKRDLQCLRPEASLVLIYRPNVAGMKGRVDLAQPVNRSPDLWYPQSEAILKLKKSNSVAQQSRRPDNTMPIPIYVTIGAEVLEQMSRFHCGLSEERPSVFKIPTSLLLIYQPKCSGDERESQTLPSPLIEPQTCVVEAHAPLDPIR
ncbi:hypothetical protein TNCV_3445181 [Trichonephila clavipes]|nr:hypothetical protein TNCV_3445181 [Trichonephila clavipes]